MDRAWFEGFVGEARRVLGEMDTAEDTGLLVSEWRERASLLDGERDMESGSVRRLLDGRSHVLKGTVSQLTEHGWTLAQSRDDLLRFTERVEAALARNRTLRDACGEPCYANPLCGAAVMGARW